MIMRQALQLQDIEEMRRENGIDDVELRRAIRALRVGNSIRLSLVTSARSFETVQVRITSIRGSTFHGKLSQSKTRPRRSNHAPALTVAFTTAHIHSIVREESRP
jgi:hypothetical protein